MTNASWATSSASAGEPTQASAARKTARGSARPVRRTHRYRQPARGARGPGRWPRRAQFLFICSGHTVWLDSVKAWHRLEYSQRSSRRFWPFSLKIERMLNHEQLLAADSRQDGPPGDAARAPAAPEIAPAERPTFKKLLADLVEERRARSDPREPIRPAGQDEPCRRQGGHQSQGLRLCGAGPAA